MSMTWRVESLTIIPTRSGLSVSANVSGASEGIPETVSFSVLVPDKDYTLSDLQRLVMAKATSLLKSDFG